MVNYAVQNASDEEEANFVLSPTALSQSAIRHWILVRYAGFYQKFKVLIQATSGYIQGPVACFGVQSSKGKQSKESKSNTNNSSSSSSNNNNNNNNNNNKSTKTPTILKQQQSQQQRGGLTVAVILGLQKWFSSLVRISCLFIDASIV
ncbi:hypothetical protein PoB_006603500 [Plakobranchus ocellatus]|uniref:Uncharacterized protein n=1 Tax=Plakobranchus ocellatus TaxID=259542 RepID=A0AAV4D612_9GAST|nr:hypothetical protein PoB_006603500 [Plakobranchus ocellatus]